MNAKGKSFPMHIMPLSPSSMVASGSQPTKITRGLRA